MAVTEGTRVVPWVDWSEWVELKEMLENGDTEQACQRVAMYRLRRRNAIPLTILTTVALVKLLENPIQDSYLQRLALSMALTRFVNGTTDRLQPRGERASARSVFGLAVELQLPLILVEIRHQASHNVLPRLAALTSGARQALSWLEQHYWVPQMKNVESTLADSLYGLRQVFRGEDEEDLEEELIAVQGKENQGMDSKLSADNSSLVLQEMTKMITKMEAKERQRERDQSKDAKVQRLRWTECGDNEAWKVSPLGLVPGQKETPRSRYLPSRRKRKRSHVGLASSETSSEEPDMKEISPEAIDRETKAEGAPSPPKAVRALSAEEEDYIAKKVIEFREFVTQSQDK